MTARKKVQFSVRLTNDDLRRRISEHAVSNVALAAMMKDIHLVEAALRYDQTIASLDDRAREHFAYAGVNVGELRSIIWVNPSKPEEKCVDWLKKGAKQEKSRKLGNIDV